MALSDQRSGTFRAGLRSGFGNSGLGVGLQQGRFAAARVAPNITRLNAAREVNSMSRKRRRFQTPGINPLPGPFGVPPAAGLPVGGLPRPSLPGQLSFPGYDMPGLPTTGVPSQVPRPLPLPGYPGVPGGGQAIGPVPPVFPHPLPVAPPSTGLSETPLAGIPYPTLPRPLPFPAVPPRPGPYNPTPNPRMVAQGLASLLGRNLF